MSTTLDHWRRSLEDYQEWTQKSLHPAYVQSVRLMGNMFSAFSESSGLVLDVGCGNGVYNGGTYEQSGYDYVRYPCSYFGIDPIAGGRRSYPFAKAVGEYLPFKSNKFDSVLVVTSLDHLFDPVAAIRESHRVLKKDGFLHIAAGLKQKNQHAEDPFHLFVLSEDQMALLLAPFFTILGLCQFQAPGLQSTFIKAVKRKFTTYYCLKCKMELNEELFRDLLLDHGSCSHCQAYYN